MTSTLILKRWMALDAQLAEGALDLDKFARKHRVSEKTIRRDLAAFRELGQRVKSVAHDSGEPRRLKDRTYSETDTLIYLWTYDGGKPLFVANVGLRPAARLKF